MIKAILLDFNGVIINDEPIQMRAYQEILDKQGIALTEAEYYECLGMDDRRFVEAAYERAGKTAGPNELLEITQAKAERWREIVSDNMPLFPGIENVVRKMANDFALGIVSMSRREDIEFVLDKTDLAECFSVMVTAEDVQNCKPDPECYRLGFKRLDLARIAQKHLPMDHDECLVIEDSPPGIIAARNADLRVLGVANTVPAEQLRAAGAEWIAKDLNDWMPASIRQVFA
jgi:HAD superfamily hydrolase (TIGR01509 family)